MANSEVRKYGANFTARARPAMSARLACFSGSLMSPSGSRVSAAWAGVAWDVVMSMLLVVVSGVRVTC